LAFCQWFNVLNCRSDSRSIFELSLLRNKWLMGGLFIGISLHASILYITPLSELFHTISLPLQNLTTILLVASFVIWVEEIRKLIARRNKS